VHTAAQANDITIMTPIAIGVKIHDLIEFLSLSLTIEERKMKNLFDTSQIKFSISDYDSAWADACKTKFMNK
jgi:hypothetical protein